MKISKLVLMACAIVVVLSLLAASCAGPPTSTPTQTTTSAPPTTAATTTAPPTSSTPSGQYGDLKIAVTTLGNENFDPALATQTMIANVLAPMTDYLFYIENSKRANGLVEKWQMSSDGLSQDMTIRKGVKFHDGSEMTTADVKFSMDQYMRKDSYFANVRDMVDRFEIVDQYTIRAFTKGRQPYLPSMLALDGSPSYGGIYPKAYIEKNGMDYFQRHPIASGAFKLTHYVGGDNVQFDALPSHWRTTSVFKSLTVILMPEEATRVASIKTGEMDIIEVSLESAIDLQKSGITSVTFDMQQPLAQLHGVYDTRAAGMPVTDIRVRQALSLAIDRAEIRNSFFFGKATKTMPPYLSETCGDIDIPFWIDYADKLYNYDPVKAKQLLKDAGYPDGFSIKLYSMVPSGAPYLPKLAEVVQSYWQKIGVKVELLPIDFGVYTAWRKGPAKELVGQATMYRSISGLDTPKRISTGFESTGTTALVGTSMPQLDRLIKESYSEIDDAKRRAEIVDAIKLTSESFTGLPIASAPSMASLGTNVKADFPLPGIPYIPAHAAVVKHK